MEQHADHGEADMWNSLLTSVGRMQRELDTYRCQQGDADPPLELRGTSSQRLLNALSCGILHVDANDRVVYANGAAVRLLELEPWSGDPPKLAEQLSRPAVVDTILNLRHSIGGAGIDCHLDQGDCHTIVRLTPIDLGGGHENLVITLQDITQLKDAERSPRRVPLTHHAMNCDAPDQHPRVRGDAQRRVLR